MNDVEEVWATIPGLEDRYSVSNLGHVMNIRTEKLIKPQLTPQGISYVPLYSDAGNVTRSIKVLVARAFVEGEDVVFDTPINMDGQKSNNRADNLVWRPRWFAVKYSRQFLTDYRHAEEGPIFDMGSDIKYDTIREVGIRFGLLFRDIHRSTYTATPVFPTDQVFRIPLQGGPAKRFVS